MRLTDLPNRPWPPVPWSEGGRIPWHDPAFSRRMLREHLTQEHDLASRRTEDIDRAVEWIHRDVLKGQKSRILDLGCGPGLYLSRLAALGHSGVGIDIGPASVAHARGLVEGKPVEIIEGDVAEVSFGIGFDLAMMIFGEFNVLPVDVGTKLLRRARHASRLLVLEVQGAAGLLRSDTPCRRWDALSEGLFSDRPHLLLTETNLDESRLCVTTRFMCVDLESSEVACVSETDRVVRDDEWESVLGETGWRLREISPSLGSEPEGAFMTLLAE